MDSRAGVYSHSSSLAVFWASVGLAFAVAAIASAYRYGGIEFILFAGFILLILYWSRRLVLARFYPSNWLVRISSSEGLYIKFRSYLNYHFPPEDNIVLHLRYGEIAWARLVEIRRNIRQKDRKTLGKHYNWEVELCLKRPATELESALEFERNRLPQGNSNTQDQGRTYRSRHRPVRLARPDRLRLQWTTRSGNLAFLEALSLHVKVNPETHESYELRRIEQLAPELQKEELRELAATGEVEAARDLARRLLGDSTSGRRYSHF